LCAAIRCHVIPSCLEKRRSHNEQDNGLGVAKEASGDVGAEASGTGGAEAGAELDIAASQRPVAKMGGSEVAE